MGPGMRAGGDRAEDCGARSDSGAFPVRKALLLSLRFLNSVGQVARNPGKGGRAGPRPREQHRHSILHLCRSSAVSRPKVWPPVGFRREARAHLVLYPEVSGWVSGQVAGESGFDLCPVVSRCTFPKQDSRLSPWVASVLVFLTLSYSPNLYDPYVISSEHPSLPV